MPSSGSAPLLARSPHLTRFLSDFTLGFSDGLTVPFALTAGLSSLGSTKTVVYAGLAELVAGSISMGIGGYLSAVDELPCPPTEKEVQSVWEEEVDERRSILGRRESEDTVVDQKIGASYEEVVRRHLEPLALPEDATASILANLAIQPGGLARTALRLQHHESSLTSSSEEPLPVSPIATGLSVSLGYVIGGTIPLIPYFFTSHVGEGLRWSMGLCLVALLFFGAGKSWVLRREGGSTFKRCAFEGVQMMVLGGLAAGSAILCVWLLDGGGD
ncbi:hypothetical protein NLU13_2302 [Sarocladium strictum]|uniref:Uncharacterized protein n=1 Tax=Sarocladium strictum TaxID=5046 RepID=A0AA39LD38_SARSR|nr:hypothetical protein NLU13_2302 [Sarocladium strictum]